MLSMTHASKLLAFIASSLLCVYGHTQQISSSEEVEATNDAGWENLIDGELSKWDKWLKEPLGLNNDPSGIYSVIDEEGVPVLKITGEIYGALTTKKSYSNYHLQMKMKWGEKKWPPRLERKRDSGICYHCYGSHGVHGGSWKACLEYQVQEKDMGDFIPLGKTKAQVRVRHDSALEARHLRYEPSADFSKVDWYVHCILEPDFPNGEWNTLDLYVIGDTAIHVVNGKFVCALKGAVKSNGETLTEGQIQIQSEAAEVYYKDIRIKNIESYPALFEKEARF